MSRPAGSPNITYSYKGRFYTLKELIAESGMNAATLKRRLYDPSFSIESAMKKPVRKLGKLYKLNGKDYTFAQLLKIWPWSESALKNRIFTRGMTAQQAFDVPFYGRRKNENKPERDRS